jgi:hypothetical protein
MYVLVERVARFRVLLKFFSSLIISMYVLVERVAPYYCLAVDKPR